MQAIVWLLMALAASGSLTMITQVGRVHGTGLTAWLQAAPLATPGTNVSPAGGPGSSRRTIWL